MSKQATGLRLRRLCAMAALPAAAAVLGFAPAAEAATNPPCVASSTATLVSCIGTANSNTGFTLIQLTANTTYLPTATMTINANVDVEISGPPQVNAISTATETLVSATNFLNKQSDLFDVQTGANVLFKAFNITQTGLSGSGWAINNNGGNVEVDNMSIFSTNGQGGLVNGGSGNMVLNNSSVLDGNNGSGVVQNSGSVAINNSTIAHNKQDGLDVVSGTATTDNSIIADNTPDCGGVVPTDVHNNGDDLDFTCFLSGSNNSPNAGNDPGLQTGATFNGGPTETETAAAGNAVLTAGTTCLTDDQRFKLTTSTSTCELGAVQQNNATSLADTTGPTCAVKSTSESTNPSVASQQVVSVLDNSGGIGLGADVIQGFSITNSNAANFGGSNGTVSWPVRGTTLFAKTDPGAATTDASEVSNVTNSEFDVTAAKPLGDTGTQHDTTWSFTATDWFGNTKLCS